MDHINRIVFCLNRCSDALNRKEHGLASELLDTADALCRQCPLPLGILYQRVKIGVELCLRTGTYKKGLRLIELNFKTLEINPEYAFDLLIRRGRLERLIHHNDIIVSSFSRALGIAEQCNNSCWIAKAYWESANMFAPRYPGLAVYFYRKAELGYRIAEKNKDALLVMLDRAFLSYIITKINTEKEIYVDRFLDEANRIVDEMDTSDFNIFELDHFQWVKACIKHDKSALEDMIDSLASLEALPQKLRYQDALLGMYMEDGDFDKARILFGQYAAESQKMHGDANKTVLENNRYLIEHEIKAKYVPYHIFKDKAEPDNMFDILDRLSVSDEQWALDNTVMRDLFPRYEHEGFFDAVEMPDKTVRLFPCSLSFNVYYRGQSCNHVPSKPALYRKDMTEADQFVERMKFVEFERVVDSYPLTSIFRNDVRWTSPDGDTRHLPLAVDTLALAQHYGIKTELMDITATSLWPLSLHAPNVSAASTCLLSIYLMRMVFSIYIRPCLLFGKNQSGLSGCNLSPDRENNAGSSWK